MFDQFLILFISHLRLTGIEKSFKHINDTNYYKDVKILIFLIHQSVNTDRIYRSKPQSLRLEACKAHCFQQATHCAPPL